MNGVSILTTRIIGIWLLLLTSIVGGPVAAGASTANPSSDDIPSLLSVDNEHFVSSQSTHTAAEDADDHAHATVITGSAIAKADTDPDLVMSERANNSHGSDSASHANTEVAASTKVGLGMNGWVAKLGASGSFNEPSLKHANRPEFGHEAADADKPELTHHAQNSNLAIKVFWAITVTTLLLAFLAAFRLARIRSSDGQIQMGFTIGSKLTLALGSLATMILLVSTLSISALKTGVDDSHAFSDLVNDAELVGSLERDVLMVRMNVKDFLITNSDRDLDQYSQYIANAFCKIHVCEELIEDPECLAIALAIEEQMVEYEEWFEKLVETIDTRNGIVEGQMNPAGKRLTDLLHAIVETAQSAGDSQAALNAAEVLGRLTLARVGTMKFLRTGDVTDAHYAISQMKEGEHELHELSQEVQNPTRKKWLAEAEAGYVFYDQRIEELVKLVNRRNEIVKDHLDKIGPQIAELGEQLVELIHDQEKAIQDEIDHTSAIATKEAIVVSVIALMVAAVVAVILVRLVTLGIGNVVTRLKDIAQGEGDLTLRVDQSRKDELGELGMWFNTFVERIHDVIVEVRGTTQQVASAATEISASSEEMAQGMTEQNGQVGQIASAIEQMSASVIEVASKSSEAANNAADSGKVAQEGGKVVDQTIEGMRAISEAVSASAASVTELGKRGEQIGEIIAVINDIADQTNLLALNAAIEAARAGEHGRGFAVVADEVRKLADRTTKATDEIGDSIKAIQTETNDAVQRMNAGTDQVTTGVERATNAGQSLQKIVASAREVADMIQSIAAAAEEQSAASEQVSRNVQSVSAVTRESSEGANQAASAATQLSSQAEQLKTLVGRFKTR